MRPINLTVEQAKDLVHACNRQIKVCQDHQEINKLKLHVWTHMQGHIDNLTDAKLEICNALSGVPQ